MKMDNRPIGFFDSGIGGLTSIRHVMNLLPNEKVVFFGDTARTPYGSKSPETIRMFSAQVADFLLSRDVKMIVIACNTATANALDFLREKYPDIPIIGCISPTAIEVVRYSGPKDVIGVMATKATVKSGVYRDKILRLNPNLHVEQIACPIIVPLIEEGLIDTEIMDLALRHYLDDFIARYHITKLVLGCTHYPLVLENISRLYPSLEQFSSSRELATAVMMELDKWNLQAGPQEPEHEFYASDASDSFQTMVKLLGVDSSAVRIKNLDR